MAANSVFQQLFYTGRSEAVGIAKGMVYSGIMYSITKFVVMPFFVALFIARSGPFYFTVSCIFLLFYLAVLADELKDIGGWWERFFLFGKLGS